MRRHRGYPAVWLGTEMIVWGGRVQSGDPANIGDLCNSDAE
jgi:hypothetical protein